ncbi:hypothetical protein [Ornithinibacillus hominis]|uniref:hypothetical protein n=1 Tax=Ornithinibacillus hominis TaxID=2763055 RepID=UPI0021060241|nr:hypothetical protein [Ornithinibacillus hominis]
MNKHKRYWDISIEVKFMKIVGVIAMLISVIPFVPSLNYAQADIECPEIEHVKETTIDDKDELVSALQIIVPDIYGKGSMGSCILSGKY